MKSKSIYFLYFILVLVLVFVNRGPVALAASDDMIQITAEGFSKNNGKVEARSESLKDAINRGSLQIIRNLIGEAAVEKHMTSIRTKILSQTSKYIQFYKASDPVKKGEQTITSVVLKVSASSLKDLLTQGGLLFQSEGLATILPLFRIYEKKEGGVVYRWWTEEMTPQNAFLRTQTIQVLRDLDTVFRPKNFYLIDPVTQHYVQWLPEPFRGETMTSEDLGFFGRFFKAQMILQGEIGFELLPNDNTIRAQIKLSALNIANGRIVGEVSRTFDGPPAPVAWNIGISQILKKAMGEISHDLVGQINDEWTKGTFGASLLKISLKGNMGYQDLESFKRQILTKLGDVKSIKERRLERGNSVFEVDASGGMTKLAQRLEAVSFDGFKTSIETLEPDQIKLRWAKVGK